MRKFLITSSLVLWFSFNTTHAMDSHPLLPGVSAVAPAAEFTRFGFSIYRAQLWAPEGRYAPDRPFVLSLTYSRDIDRDRIVQASLDEMQKLGLPVRDQPNWRAELERVLTDVKQGDTLTAIYSPGQGAEFFYRNNKLGRLDEALAVNFFSIWLDARTSEPELRLALLGQKK